MDKSTRSDWETALANKFQAAYPEVFAEDVMFEATADTGRTF